MKNKGIIYVLSILLAIILLGGCSVVGTYNGLVSEQTKVEQAQADVATALQRRSDLIGNLVESVKGQMNHETEVFTQIAEARAKIGNGSVTSKENQEAQGELSSAISRLLVLTENYPELKSNQNVEQLMTELAGSENRIFVARKDYNQAATDYNQKLRSFPTVLFANMMNFKEAETFKESEEAKTAPKVEMEKLLQLLVLVPYFYFFSWERKVQPGSKPFSFLYYFYWIYLPLMALFSLAFTLFSLILFNFILLEPKDLARWLIWIVLVLLSLLNDWIVYTGLKFMKKLRLEKKKANLP